MATFIVALKVCVAMVKYNNQGKNLSQREKNSTWGKKYLLDPHGHNTLTNSAESIIVCVLHDVDTDSHVTCGASSGLPVCILQGFTLTSVHLCKLGLIRMILLIFD